MKYSQRETFFWLNGAVLLDKTVIIAQGLAQLDQNEQNAFWAGEMPGELIEQINKLATPVDYAQEVISTAKSYPKEIRDFCDIRRSLHRASTILLALGQREISIDELDKRQNESDGLTYDSSDGFRVSVKKAELSRTAATGEKGNCDWLVNAGVITKADLRRAMKRNRRPLFDADFISIVARYLVNYWCGETGVYGMWRHYFQTPDRKLSQMVGVVSAANGDYSCKKGTPFFFAPPLCFFSNDALATFIALALGKRQSAKDTSSTAIRKWVSRLGLKHAARPKIREVKITGDEIRFLL